KLSEKDFNEIFDTWWPKLKQSIEAIKAGPEPVLKAPSPDELLQEILGLTRNLAIEQQKLMEALKPSQGGLNPQVASQVAAYVRALLTPSPDIWPSLPSSDKPTIGRGALYPDVGTVAKSE